MVKKTIAVDIDDVLSASAEAFIAFSNKQWGHTLSVDDYLEEWAVVWQVDLDEAARRADLVHTYGDTIIASHRVFDDAYPVLQRLRKRFNLIVVTSRRKVLQPATEKWISQYFPDIFSAVHYAGIWDSESHILEKVKATKAELCLELGADYLIDDQPKHCIAAAEAGIASILFGDYKWSRYDVVPNGVTRIHSWREVEEYFNAQS